MDEYKVAIIDNMGNTNFIGGGNEFHSDCLLNFAHEKYSDYEVFKKLSYRHSPEVISFFFVELFQDIVFLNTSSKKHINIGILLLPRELGDNQREVLLQFLDTIKDFKIGLCTDLRIEKGSLESKESYSLNNETPRELVEKYLGIGGR